MQWGDELLETLCGTAYGRVIRIVKNAEGEGRYLLCNFGSDFGTQKVSEKDCKFVRPAFGDNERGEATVNEVSLCVMFCLLHGIS